MSERTDIASRMTSTQALVSVVMPTFNRAMLLPRAVQSVLTQSHANIELLIADDGSTDDTRQVVEHVISRDPRVHYCLNRYAKGCAGARNTAVQEANGQYVAFLDDDDEYCPDKIAADVRTFCANPQADVVVSCVSPAVLSLAAGDCGWVGAEFHPHRLFASCTVVCRRTVFEHVRFRANHMEWRDLAFQLYDSGCSVALSEHNLVRENSTLGSLSKHEEAMFRVALANAAEYCESSRERPEHGVFERYLANCHKNMGNYWLKRFRPWKAATHFARSYKSGGRIRDAIPFT